jgi:hypothetical protein
MGLFESGWKSGDATIVERMSLGTGSVGNAAAAADPVYRYVAEVRLDAGGQPFRVELEEPRFMPMFRAPGVGEVVRVKADQKKREAKFDKSDPTISLDAQADAIRSEEKARFDAALEGSPDDQPQA